MLCYGSEVWTTNKRDAQKLEAAQMRFLRLLLGLTRLDRQRNSDICNRLKVDNILEDIISEELDRSSEMNGQKSHTETNFTVPT
jgi:hypothetical protein